MAWTEVTRHRYERNYDGYSSDVTDAEWAVAGLLLPGPNTLGRTRRVKLRQVWDAIQYLAATGCAWSLLPHDFPPVSTVRSYFYRWRAVQTDAKTRLQPVLSATGKRIKGRQAPHHDRRLRKPVRNRGSCGQYPGPPLSAM